MNKCNLLIAGDYHIYGRFDEFISRNPNHNLFKNELLEKISGYDIRIFNLEDPITDSRNGCIKSGPYGVGSERCLDAIDSAKFQIATFSTNHTYDMKNQGIIDTIEICKKHNIDVIGAGLTPQEAGKPYIIDINGIRITLLNYSRIEFNCVNNQHGGANPLKTINNYREIQKTKQCSDFVIVIVHDGVDVFNLPYPKLIDRMRFYAEAGADAIILHHSQAFSGYEVYGNVPIFYGIGNLLHLTNMPYDKTGYMVGLSIEKGNPLKFEIIPIHLDDKDISVNILIDREKEIILDKINDLSNLITSPESLKNEWLKHISNLRVSYLSSLYMLPPLFYKILKKLKLLNTLEHILLLNKKRLLPILNLIRCDAHREAVIEYLEGIFYEEE